MIRFDLWPLLQGQMSIAKIKSAYNSLVRVSSGLQCHTNLGNRKSWAKNLLMWSDFTLGSSFKVKRWLIGFGEFSFWWIQFASVLQCTRSSY